MFAGCAGYRDCNRPNDEEQQRHGSAQTPAEKLQGWFHLDTTGSRPPRNVADRRTRSYVQAAVACKLRLCAATAAEADTTRPASEDDKIDDRIGIGVLVGERRPGRKPRYVVGPWRRTFHTPLRTAGSGSGAVTCRRPAKCVFHDSAEVTLVGKTGLLRREAGCDTRAQCAQGRTETKLAAYQLWTDTEAANASPGCVFRCHAELAADVADWPVVAAVAQSFDEASKVLACR